MRFVVAPTSELVFDHPYYLADCNLAPRKPKTLLHTFDHHGVYASTVTATEQVARWLRGGHALAQSATIATDNFDCDSVLSTFLLAHPSWSKKYGLFFGKVAHFADYEFFSGRWKSRGRAYAQLALALHLQIVKRLKNREFSQVTAAERSLILHGLHDDVEKLARYPVLAERESERAEKLFAAQEQVAKSRLEKIDDNLSIVQLDDLLLGNSVVTGIVAQSAAKTPVVLRCWSGHYVAGIRIGHPLQRRADLRKAVPLLQKLENQADRKGAKKSESAAYRWFARKDVVLYMGESNLDALSVAGVIQKTLARQQK